ncbi:MAG: thioredoxin family protein [Peptococcaceae bacterium]|nr:thioredoxin family protein [Peptococcaceae bacterium]
MLKLHTIEEVRNYIAQDGLSILEIASSSCTPCVSIRRKIEEWAIDYPAIGTAYLEIEEIPEAAGELQIFTAPAVLVFANGKRCIEQAGYFSMDEIFRQMERYIELMR